MLLDLNLAHKKTLIDICEPAILHDYMTTGQRIFATAVTLTSQCGCPL